MFPESRVSIKNMERQIGYLVGNDGDKHSDHLNSSMQVQLTRCPAKMLHRLYLSMLPAN
jgi:hypothetical protein